jgi:hypothetical protein
MDDELYLNYLGPDGIDELKLLKIKLKECVWQHLANNESLKQKIHQFIEFSYDKLKSYETGRHDVPDEFRQTQYEHILLFCFALQAIPETLKNATIQNEVQHISNKLGIDYPIDIAECCNIFDKVIHFDDAVLSEYNLTYILLKLENPISQKSGLRDFATMLQSLLTQLKSSQPAYVFIDIVNHYVKQRLS